jgi:DNA polymerase III sliding clamp (beta) subunit (PCNA family)
MGRVLFIFENRGLDILPLQYKARTEKIFLDFSMAGLVLGVYSVGRCFMVKYPTEGRKVSMLIPQNVFKVSGAASTDHTRYQLNGIHLQRLCDREVKAEATNGKILMQVKWTEPDQLEYPARGIDTSPKEHFSVTIPLGTCKEAGKLAPKKPQKPILDNVVLDEQSANGKVNLFGTDLEAQKHFESLTVEGTFPNVDCLWNKNLPKESFMLQSSNLLDLLKTIEAVHGKELTLKFSFFSSDRPIEIVPVTAPGEPTSRAMVMPLVLENKR